MARNWREVRADAIADGHLTEAEISQARRTHDEQARAFRLRQVRQSRLVRQEDIAAEMKVSQSRISRIEAGEIDRSELGTLRAYVQALGGTLKVTAEFGDEHLTIG